MKGVKLLNYKLWIVIITLVINILFLFYTKDFHPRLSFTQLRHHQGKWRGGGLMGKKERRRNFIFHLRSSQTNIPSPPSPLRVRVYTFFKLFFNRRQSPRTFQFLKTILARSCPTSATAATRPICPSSSPSVVSCPLGVNFLCSPDRPAHSTSKGRRKHLRRSV